MVNTVTKELEQYQDYYPYGKPHDAAVDASDNRRKFGGKELITDKGYDAYDFEARPLTLTIPHFTQPDNKAENYYPTSIYVYCAGDPINLIDPTGEKWADKNNEPINDLSHVKVYIFYTDEFREQALIQYDQFTKDYGEGAVALSNTGKSRKFAEDWRNMTGNISDVLIMTHGSNQSINIANNNNTSYEQITSTGNGRTNRTDSPAVNVSDLPNPIGDITNARLSLYSCHSMDAVPYKHNGQAPLTGSKLTIGQSFAKYFNFKEVMGTASAVNYYHIGTLFLFGGLKPQNLMKPYPKDQKWILLRNR